MTTHHQHRPANQPTATHTRGAATTATQQRTTTAARGGSGPTNADHHRTDGGGPRHTTTTHCQNNASWGKPNAHHHNHSHHNDSAADHAAHQRRPPLHRNPPHHNNNNNNNNNQHPSASHAGTTAAVGGNTHRSAAAGSLTYPTFRDHSGSLWYSNDPYSDAAKRKKTPTASASVPPTTNRANSHSGSAVGTAPPPPATKVNYCRHYLLGQCNRGTMCRFAHLEQHHVVLRSSRREAQGLRARSASPPPSSTALFDNASSEYDDRFGTALSSVSPPPHLTTSPERSYQEDSYDDVSAVFLPSAEGTGMAAVLPPRCVSSWCMSVSSTTALPPLQRRGSSHRLPLTPSPEVSYNESFTHNPYAAVRCHHPYAGAMFSSLQAEEEQDCIERGIDDDDNDTQLCRTTTEADLGDNDDAPPLDASDAADDVRTTTTTAVSSSSGGGANLRLPRNETQSYVDRLDEVAAASREDDGGESATDWAAHRALSSAPVSLHPSPSLSYHPDDYHHHDDMDAIVLPTTTCGRMASPPPAAAYFTSAAASALRYDPQHFYGGGSGNSSEAFHHSHRSTSGGGGGGVLLQSGRRHSPAAAQLQWSEMLNSQTYATASGEFASSSQTHSHNATPQLTPEEEQTLKSLW